MKTQTFFMPFALLALVACAANVSVLSSARRPGTGTGDAAKPLRKPGQDCLALPTIDRIQVLARSGHEAKLVGGRIVGSNESSMNGFEDIATIAAAPAVGEWAELTVSTPKSFRFVKYYAPPESYANVAEVKFFTGRTEVTGKGFGIAGSKDNSGNTFEKALDGDKDTFFEAPLPTDNYVGYDLGDEKQLSAPQVELSQMGDHQVAEISSTDPDAAFRFTLDGTDPKTGGQPYQGPVEIPAAGAILKVYATQECHFPSDVVTQQIPATPTQGQVTDPGSGPGAPGGVALLKTLHIGNSLTDTIVGTFPDMVSSAKLNIDFHRFTIPGAGTRWIWENPTAGFGEKDLKATLQTLSLDHISFQPFPNMPCKPVGDESDADYIGRFLSLTKTKNPKVQTWIYQQWPGPVNDLKNCTSFVPDWVNSTWRSPMEPTTWEEASNNQLAYMEAVRSAVVELHRDLPAPLIVPGGKALVNLKKAVESGGIPDTSNFFPAFFDKNGTDIHLNSEGRYFISLVFFGCLYKTSPEGKVSHSGTTLSNTQAQALEQIAWETVRSYPLSGVVN